MSPKDSRWSSVEEEIASLLLEISREEHSVPEISDDGPSKTYRLLRALLVVSGAAFVIGIVSPYLAWFAASLTW